MQRTLSFLFVGLVSGFALTGCPEKKAEKEPPAAPDDTAEENAVADEETEAAADQKKPEPEKKAEPAPAPAAAPAPAKKADDKAADEGGW